MRTLGRMRDGVHRNGQKGESMDLLLEIVGDWLLDLFGKSAKNSKNTRKQKLFIALISVGILAMVGYEIWSAITNYRQGNIALAIAFTAAAVVSVLVAAFVVIRRRSRKTDSTDGE